MDFDSNELFLQFQAVREQTTAICASLEVEDHVVQPEPDVSPPRWHLGHTTWFFETFILREFLPSFRVHDEIFGYLFNSYYEGEGDRLRRELRGSVSRPTLRSIHEYRKAVDGGVAEVLSGRKYADNSKLRDLMLLGINHEQQHQELLLTDIKAILEINPPRPAYRGDHLEKNMSGSSDNSETKYETFDGALVEVGASPGAFSFDNERPRHRKYSAPFQIAHSLVTNDAYLRFISDGGYQRPTLWLADGWEVARSLGWNAPRYWRQVNGSWKRYTLNGEIDLDLGSAVCHVSYYEADAFARWSNCRLPTEEEWERAATEAAPKFRNLYGSAWQWTSSGYGPFPGFFSDHGSLGEYNGKFMCNQMVLRGGSWATPQGHSRPTYRNFFHCDKRWQATGIRLARSV